MIDYASGNPKQLIEYSQKLINQNKLHWEKRLGALYSPLFKIKSLLRRINGDFSKEDQLRLACMCEPPLYFLNRGIMIPHAYGITLSADEIGADVQLGQNVTIGTSGRDMSVTDYTTGHKPIIGNLVRFYSGCVVSGKIRIGNNVIVTANTVVDKDVPDNSIVYGINVVKPLQEHHKQYLKNQLWHCKNTYHLVPGLVYINQKMYIDRDYAAKRDMLFL